jgi:membrane protein DedA with SNARE-associated domain
VSNVLTALLQFFQHDFSWLAQFFSLLFLPFAHEDLAILLGGYIVVNKIMPAALVALCIYGGMVASDFALYGIGAGARHLPWLTRLAVNDRVRGFGDTLKRNLFGLVALCRVVPGVVFFALIACGWTRVPLARFTMATLIVSALYLPLMLCIVVFFGDALDDRVGLWTWPFLLCVLVAIGFLRRQVFTFQESPQGADAERLTKVAAGGHRGMPALTDRACKPTFTERIPLVLLCLPLALSWIGFALRYRSLTLPTVANPRARAPGNWGETASDYLLDVAAGQRHWVAPFVVARRSAGPATLEADLAAARQSLCDAGIEFPLIAKPDIGGRSRCIEDAAALRDYFLEFPAGDKLVLQRFVPYAGEAMLLYARLPGAQNGRILSLTFRYGPHWTGDGRTIYCDARRYITPLLEARFDQITRGMREFHYGRFDLRFASSDDLLRGENFLIVEIGGIGSEAKHAWDPSLSLTEVYHRLIDRQRIMFLIGEKNRDRGFEPAACADVVKSLVSRLRRPYPMAARTRTSVGTKGTPATL